MPKQLGWESAAGTLLSKFCLTSLLPSGHDASFKRCFSVDETFWRYIYSGIDIDISIIFWNKLKTKQYQKRQVARSGYYLYIKSFALKLKKYIHIIHIRFIPIYIYHEIYSRTVCHKVKVTWYTIKVKIYGTLEKVPEILKLQVIFFLPLRRWEWRSFNGRVST